MKPARHRAAYTGDGRNIEPHAHLHRNARHSEETCNGGQIKQAR